MDSFIFDGVRTPFGRRAGALASVRPDDLLAACIRALVERSSFDPSDIEDVIAGCTSQSGEDARNVARHASLVAGLPVGVAAQTVNRLCGSGLQAVLSAAHATALGAGSVFVAGGVESMTRAPFVISKSDTAFARQVQVFEALGARFSNPRLEQMYGKDAMPQTAENVAKDLGITREESDSFSVASQLKYAAAEKDGFFVDEILPVEIRGKKGVTTFVAKDEHPRSSTTLEGLAALPTLYKEGVVTAGNASGVNDGAVALIIASAEAGKRVGARARGRIVSGAVVGVEPRVMGLGPVEASRKALARAGLDLSHMDVIELNEAFAAQALGCLKMLGLSGSDSRVNPNGGAIAIGHPLGASGTRIVLTALRQLERTGGRYALVTMCIGVGQGIAAVIERLD